MRACRLTLALLVLLCGCDEDEPMVDAGGTPDAGPGEDAGWDAGFTPPACEGEWIAPTLGEPTVETISMQIAGGDDAVAAPERSLPLHHRVLTPSGTTRPLAQIPAGVFRLMHASRASRSAVRRQAEYLEPLGRGFLLARMRPTFDGTPVRDIGPLLPEDKLLPGVREAERLTIERWTDGAVRSAVVSARGVDVDALSRNPDVLRIGPLHVPAPTLDHSRELVNADEVQRLVIEGGVPRYEGLTGAGVRVAIADTGVLPEHPDFQRYDASGTATGTRVVGGHPDTGNDEGRHGTLVAGFVAGNGYFSEGETVGIRTGTPFQWRGVAPGVEQIVSVVSVAEDMAWATAFVTYQAHLSNNSHTQSYGNYGFLSREWDRAVHGEGETPRISVFSQGNNGAFHSHQMIPVRGYYAATAPSKNPIVVGGANANDGSHAAGSACGPTLDGRLKPDLVAPGYVDWRPPDGARIALEAVGLRAIAGSGVPDLEWTPETTDDAWSTGGDVASGTVVGGRLEYTAFGGGTVTYEPTDPIDVSLYDRVFVRYEVLEAADEALYHAPEQLGVRWDRDGNGRLNRANWPLHPPDRGLVAFERELSNFNGSPTRLQFQPANWNNRSVIVSHRGGYTQSGGGTSLSAPVTSGVVAMLLEQLARDFGYELDLAPPAPATIKAILLHTATDLVRPTPWSRDPANPDTMEPVTYHEGPDWATGYGLVDAARATSLVASASGADADRWTERTIGENEIHTYTIAVSGDAGPLRATLAWDDPAGSTAPNPTVEQLVHDLDLVLVSPSGVAYGPWILTPPPLGDDPLAGIDPITTADIVPATRCAETSYWDGATTEACEDHLNNVEQVLVDAPEPGVWTLRVRAADVWMGEQAYSLVLSQPCAE